MLLKKEYNYYRGVVNFLNYIIKMVVVVSIVQYIMGEFIAFLSSYKLIFIITH